MSEDKTDKASAEKAAAAEKASVEKKAAVDAATSVADAVKRVADAAVSAVQKTEAAPAQDFTVAGNDRGGFTIRGKGFSSSGVVKINGHQATTIEWGDALIVGRMPDGVKAGTVTVEVAVDQNTVQRGTFKV